MTNFAFEKAMAKLGIGFARAKVGDRYVLELLREKGWQLGGENSGHVICLDKHTTGDGIVSALQVLRRDARVGPLARRAHRRAGDVSAGAAQRASAARLRLEEARRRSSRRSTTAEQSLNGKGRVLLRPSGTEPVLRVMVEGEPREAIESAAKSIADAVKHAAR